MAPPLIGVSIGRYPAERYSVHRGYEDAIWACGGHPLLLLPTPGEHLAHTLALAGQCDAFVLTGGGDVGPERYGGPTDGELQDLDSTRDDTELALVDLARALSRPVLGICRGIQLLAVAHGGSLVPDLPTAGHDGHWDEERQHEPVHGVRAEPGSRAERALAGRDRVNSIHHQAVADPGDLAATAHSHDGVIEAVEGPGVLGVQWHPERLLGWDLDHLAPFHWLVEEARAGARPPRRERQASKAGSPSRLTAFFSAR